MTGISNKTIQFLKDLKKNNDREWFNANKQRFEDSRKEFEEFIGALIRSIAKFEPAVGGLDPKKCVFRIYRDTRFSKDKSPYKPNFGAHISMAVSKLHDKAGYYIHLEPGQSFLAGGAYEPPAPWLNAIRKEIDYNAKEFKKIISAASFKKYFGEMEGEKLKTAPKGFSKDHPELDLLQYKSFLAVHKFDDKQAMSDDFLKHCTDVFKAMKPFDDFLNRAAEG